MNAVIIYDEFERGAKARAMLARADDRAYSTVPWNVSPWRLDMLRQPPTDDDALRDALRAHLLVLAISDYAPLPPWLFDWLEAWARRRQIGDAALAVCDDGDGDTLSTSPAFALSQFAERHGLSFIQDDVHPDEEVPPVFLSELREREADQTAILEHAFAQYENYRGWGIND